jgi:type I restriction enzyme M protein
MNDVNKPLESWIWDAACSIRGAKDAAKYKEFILPLIFAKRLCDVFDDEVARIAQEVGSRAKAFKLVKHDKKLVRFYLPIEPKNPDDAVWSVIRTLSDRIGEQLTTHLRAIADANPLLKGIIDRVDFNATTHGQRDIDDNRLSNLIEAISAKRLGLADVDADIIGRSYEYLIRKFAEGSGQSAGEFYTPGEVGTIMALIMDPQPGMTVNDPTCGSASLLIKCERALEERMNARGKLPSSSERGATPPGREGGEAGATLPSPPGRGAGGEGMKSYAPLKLYGQESEPGTWAMANMNMIIHDMEGEIQIGDTFRKPKFRKGNRLQTFDRVVANPMWNQKEFKEKDYDADELDRFPKGAGFPGQQSADWGWMQHILSSLKPAGRAAVVLDTGAASRGSGGKNRDKERDIRHWFVEQDLIEGVLYLPENLFYNTTAPGIVIVLNKAKPKERQGKLFLLNAGREFVKGDPKNYIPEDAITAWKEVEKYSRIVTREEIAKNDFNISPSRYIHTGEGEEYRPIAEIVEELDALEEEAKVTDALLKSILTKLIA